MHRKVEHLTLHVVQFNQPYLMNEIVASMFLITVHLQALNFQPSFMRIVYKMELQLGAYR